MFKFMVAAGCLVGVVLLGGSRDLTAPPLKIDNASVSTEMDAKRLAFDGYVKKMKAKVLATEGVRDIEIITLGWDVDGFASKGQRVWELRVKTINDELRSIIWVHPDTRDIHFLAGPWGVEVAK